MAAAIGVFDEFIAVPGQLGVVLVLVGLVTAIVRVYGHRRLARKTGPLPSRAV